MADLRKLKDEATQAFAKGKFAKAAGLFSDLVKADPKDLQAQMKLGDALVKAGSRPKAVVVYQQLAERYANDGFLPKAIAVCKVILEVDPKHSATQQVLAGLYAKKLGTDLPPRASPPPAVAVEPAPVAVEPAPVDVEPAPPEEIVASASALPPELDPALYAAPSAPPPPPAPLSADAQSEGAHPVELEVVPSAAARAQWSGAPASVESAPAPSSEARPPTRPPPLESWGRSVSLEAELAGAVDESPAPLDVALEVADPAIEVVDADLVEGEDIAFDDAFDVPMADSVEEEIELFSVTAELEANAGLEPSARPLPKIPLFSDLTPEAFVALMEQCGLVRAEPGQAVISQGDAGNSFFVICSGRMKVTKRDERGDEQVIAYLTEGAFFGEMALLSGLRRTATVSAEEDSDLLEISAPVLNALVKSYPHVEQSIRKFGRQRLLADVMATSPLFRPFDRATRKTLVELFKVREVQPAEVVIHEGQSTDGLYLVMNGEVEVRRTQAFGPDTVLAQLREGDIFGEMSLLSKKPASATVVAKRRTNVLRLPRDRFSELVVTYPQVLVLVSELADSRTRRDAAAVLAPDQGAPLV